MRIRILAESEKYVRDEVYLSRTLSELEKHHDVFIDDLSQKRRVASSIDATLSMVRVRNLLKYADRIGQDPVIVNDYDPWCSLAVSQPYTGLYENIWRRLSVQSFLVSSYEWCKISREMGYPTAWYRIGAAKSDCSHGGKLWDDRTVELEFRGSRHDFRIKAFERLAEAGLTVPWPLTKVPLKDFGSYLNTVRVWAHDESQKFHTIQGKQVESNWLWPKTCEVLARGCFVIRDAQSEMRHYDLVGIPTLITYDGIENAAETYRSVVNMSTKEKDERIEYAVQLMSQIDPYADFATRFEHIIKDTR